MMTENAASYNTGNHKPDSFKAIVTGDLHYRGTNPRARLDDFQKALEAKLSEVFVLARRHEAHCVIIPGDIFDGPAASWSTVVRLTQILWTADCPILTVSGNHDIFGGNKQSKFRTPYGFLVQTGFLRDVEESEFDGPENVIITGCGFSTDTDTNTPEGKAQFDPRTWVDGAFHIHVVHSMLMDREPGFKMRHTLISEVETSADVIISGHEHNGFGFCFRSSGELDAPLFINPGALCRLSAHATEMERTVQVALLEVKDGGNSVDVKLIPLKSALPGHEVLSREHIESAAERESRIDEFLKLLASEGEAKFLEVREIVEDLAARESIPAEVKSEALRRIGAAREALGGEAS